MALHAEQVESPLLTEESRNEALNHGTYVSGIFAISDLHVDHAGNRDYVDQLWPESDDDWLIIAGDVAEYSFDVKWALRRLSQRYAKVIWTPGNHELWTLEDDPLQLRGEARYQYLVEMCRELGVVTPEDPYPVWPAATGPIVVAPLFVLYDYSFRPDGAGTRDQGLEIARNSGVICMDEFLLHSDPFPSRETWCHARLEMTEKRLAEIDEGSDTILVNHFPLIREPTRKLKRPAFAQWCGTERTSDWHVRFRAVSVVYGHLHIPCSTRFDGVAFEEVSIGYPREWRRRPSSSKTPRPVSTERL